MYSEFIYLWRFSRGPFLEDPYNKDHSILGSIFGSPYFGKLPCKMAISFIRSMSLRNVSNTVFMWALVSRPCFHTKP